MLASINPLQLTMSQIKKREHLLKCSRWTIIFYDVSIFCLRSRHPNRRSHQCTFLNLFYVKITLFNKDKMFEKMLKIKDFHPLLRCSNTTHSTWIERTEWMSFVYVRSRKHIHDTFCTIGRREHIHRLRCFLKNWGMLLIFSTQYCE